MTYNNCLIWAVTQKIKYGGKINWHKARTWFGFHSSWTDTATSVTWEYTVLDQRRQPWWYIPILYKGVVRRKLKQPIVTTL
jgi:hypothetical protein